MYSLISSGIWIQLWCHHYNQGHDCLQQLQKFLCPPSNLSLPLSSSTGNHWSACCHHSFFHFLAFCRNGVIQHLLSFFGLASVTQHNYPEIYPCWCVYQCESESCGLCIEFFPTNCNSLFANSYIISIFGALVFACNLLHFSNILDLFVFKISLELQK